MARPALEQTARRLVSQGVAVYRFNWAYHSADPETGSPSPDLADELHDLLAVRAAAAAQPRSLQELTERRPGIFYWRSKGCLHFHEDRSGLFADVKLDLIDDSMLAANTPGERERLVEATADSLAAINASARASQ